MKMTIAYPAQGPTDPVEPRRDVNPMSVAELRGYYHELHEACRVPYIVPIGHGEVRTSYRPPSFWERRDRNKAELVRVARILKRIETFQVPKCVRDWSADR